MQMQASEEFNFRTGMYILDLEIVTPREGMLYEREKRERGGGVISALRFLSPMQYTIDLAFYRFYLKGRSVIFNIEYRLCPGTKVSKSEK